MAMFVVSTKRDLRGRVPLPGTLLAGRPGIRVEVDCNPDLVWIDTTIEITTGLKTELSDEYLVEAENPHNTLGE